MIVLGLLLLFLPTISTFYFKSIYKANSFGNEVDIDKSLSDNTYSDESIKIDKELLRGSFNEELSPDRILIPSVSIDLLVKPARVVNGRWELFDDSAAFGKGSATPGSVGNIVIFAHAREDAFLPLKKVQNEDVVYLLVDDTVFKYSIYDIKEVLPDDVGVLASSENEILTLYTCSGFQDLKRLIVVAKRI